ncbi:response regulator transcription factor [Gordonia polyisoprenivorans]|uniref:response regulator transcription factor n=2 Tax=Gordonia TaxID=2053 RepID=UPI0003719CE0|nr:LuxR C-terminal-related transcriptional regulator [Gordonia polyisoprenivorans]
MLIQKTPSHAADVVVIASGTALDHALVALVEKCGYSATVAGPEFGLSHKANVLIVSDELMLRTLPKELLSSATTLIGIRTSDSQTRGHRRGVVWLSGTDTVGQLGRILHRAVGPGSNGRGGPRVHLSHREREVLGSYTMGATVTETAAIHFIAASTVKAHYRRVVAKYEAAGRLVENKAQLMVELIADGWLDSPWACACESRRVG